MNGIIPQPKIGGESKQNVYHGGSIIKQTGLPRPQPRLFWLVVVPRGGGGHLHPISPLSLKLDGSNFQQNYFGMG